MNWIEMLDFQVFIFFDLLAAANNQGRAGARCNRFRVMRKTAGRQRIQPNEHSE